MTSLGHALKTSDLFVKALENEGVKYIFAVPGAQHNPTSHAWTPAPCDAESRRMHVLHAQARRTWTLWSRCAHPASSSLS